MQFWSLNVSHSCLFLKHTAQGCQISRKSYNQLTRSCNTGLQVKGLHLLAPILNVHWLRGKNYHPSWIKEPLTKKRFSLTYFEHVGNQSCRKNPIPLKFPIKTGCQSEQEEMKDSCHLTYIFLIFEAFTYVECLLYFLKITSLILSILLSIVYGLWDGVFSILFDAFIFLLF